MTNASVSLRETARRYPQSFVQRASGLDWRNFMLNSKQRAALRSMAAQIQPIMQIGKGGVSENLAKTVSDALEARELIKLSVLENCDYTTRDIAEELAEATESEVVAVIGRRVVLYRESKTKKKIEV